MDGTRVNGVVMSGHAQISTMISIDHLRNDNCTCLPVSLITTASLVSANQSKQADESKEDRGK